MASILIELWPSRAIEAPGETPDETSKHVVASGRRGLQMAVGLLDGSRETLIALPQYSSHCVISAVAKRCTPLPITVAAGLATEIGQILLYDQWGWEREVDALSEVRDTFVNASIILDRVDTLTRSIEDLPARYQGQDAVQVFSLGKTLGLGGGGLVYHHGDWVPRTVSGTKGDAAIGEALDGLCDRHSAQTLALVKSWRMADLQSLPPGVSGWLGDNSLASAVEAAATHRARHLKVVRDVLDELNLPGWMRDQVLGPEAVAGIPGILPLFASEGVDTDGLARQILDWTGIQVASYHFDRSPSYLTPDWQKCIAVPLHWEVETLDKVIDVWRGTVRAA